MKVLVIGEINVDLILQNFHTFPALGKEVLVEDCFLTLGSASMICAMGLCRLRNDVSFAGKIGCDVYGEFCARTMQEAGIDVSRIVRDAALKTGITVSITSAADRALVTYPGSMLHLRAGDLDKNLFDGFGHLHISSFFLQEALRPSVRDLFTRARTAGLTTSLDPGYDPAEEWRPDILDAIADCDLFFPNELELQGITGCSDPVEALRRLENGRTLTVAKLGRHGATVLEGGRPVHVPAFRADAVDTTGAGDSFNAGFLDAWFRKKPLTEALRFGAACGAISTLALGGTTCQATPERADEFLDSGVQIS